MNIFIRELRANRKALIIWSVCMVLLVLSGMGKYTAYSSSGTASQAINKLPYSIRALFGFGLFDVSTISGFFAILFLFLEIFFAVHAVLLGSGIFAKEEKDKTIEFVMSKPVSRNALVTSKFLAAVVNILILNLVTFVSSVALVSYYNNGKDITTEIMMMFIGMFFVQLIFLSLGSFLAAFIKSPKSSGSAAIGIMLGTYMLSKITEIKSNLEALNIFTPFKYFDLNKIISENSLNYIVVLLCVLLSAAFIALTYIIYKKRNFSL
jgi:ABC-2 type transport system permease protein